MPSGKSSTRTKSKKSKVSKLTPAANPEKWDIVRKLDDPSERCRMESCQRTAVECWASDRAPDDLWNLCAECVESEFGPPLPQTVTDDTLAPNDVAVTQETTTSNVDPLAESSTDECFDDDEDKESSDSSHQDEDIANDQADEKDSDSIHDSTQNDPPDQDDTTETLLESHADVAVESTIELPVDPLPASAPHETDTTTAILLDSAVTPASDPALPTTSPETEEDGKERSDVEMGDVDEGWDLKKVFSHAELSASDTVRCQGCKLSAAVVYVSTLTKEEWYTCIDCQLVDFGGWPENIQEIPIKAISADHKIVMTEKCSLLQLPVFPDLPEQTCASPSSENMDHSTDIDSIHPPPVPSEEGSTGVNEEDSEEGWDLKKVMSYTDLSKSGTIKCSTEACILAAATLYMSTLSKEKWYACLDCQDRDYGGWPEKIEEIPIHSMSQDHKQIMTEKCTCQSKPVFPNFPESPIKKIPGNTNSQTPPPNGAQQVTPTPGAKKSQPSAQAMAIHRKWQMAAEQMGGPDARIVVEKKAAKKLVFDLLYDAFCPMNITQIHAALKATVPSPVLKQCLDDMMLSSEDDGNLFAESDDDEPKASKMKPKIANTEEYAASLSFKAGRNANTSLYYVDHTKQKNDGNGLDFDARDTLYTEKAKAEDEEARLKKELSQMEADTKRLNSEPTNEDLISKIDANETITRDLREKLEDARKLKVNEKHRMQIKRRIDGMVTQFRKRRRLCMDFLISMEENSDGTISMKKCLAGDGQIDIESDEKAVKDSKIFAENVRARKARGLSGKKKSITETGNENFVGVELDSQGTIRRIYLDEDGN